MKKKIFMLAVMLTVVMFSQVRADDYAYIVGPDANDKAILTCAVGSTSDLTMIPITVSLSNSIAITAVEGCVRLPGGLGPDKVLYNEDDEDFVYDASARWNKTHALTAFAGTHSHGWDAFFFSIVSSKSAYFNGTDGDIITFYFDGSSLADGEYEADFFDAISVTISGWNDDVTVITYKQFDTKCKFIISGGRVIDPNAYVRIAELQSLVSSAQTKCNNVVEGTVGGNYNPGSKAALQAVINEVNAKISDTMTDEEIEDATAKINAAVAAFEMQKVYDNYVYPVNVEGAAGKQVELPILLKNKAEISDLQFDLVLPEGVSIALDEDGFALIDLSDERTTSKRHTVDYSVRSDGSTRILCISSKGLMFNGNEGSVVIVTLNVSNDMEEGEYPVIVKDIVMSNADSVYTVPQKESVLNIINYVLGDVNFDGNINVGDLSRLIKLIVTDYTQKDNTFKAADINGDNTLNVGDYSKLVKMILSEPASANNYAGGVKSKAYAVSSADVEIDNATVAAGGEKQIAVRLNNNGESFVAMQFDIALPEGLTLAEGGLETSARTKGFNVETNGKRVVVYNTSNKVISDTEGNVLYLTLKADKEMLSGNYDVDIDNIILATEEADVLYANAYRSQINVDKLTNVGGVETNEGVTATAVSGGIAISSDKDQVIAIYTPAGVLVAKEQIASGETKRISLSKGVYVVNNVKIIVE